MSEEFKESLERSRPVAFLSDVTGLRAALIVAIGSFALSAVLGIYFSIKQYDRGWDDYEAQLRKGSIQLDGKRVEIMDEAAKESLVQKAKAEALELSQRNNNMAYREGMRDGLRQHTKDVNTPVEPLLPDAIDWGEQPVPDSERMRFDRTDAARLNGDSGGADNAAYRGPELVGNSTANGTPTGKKE